jgi:hypothetical protein
MGTPPRAEFPDRQKRLSSPFFLILSRTFQFIWTLVALWCVFGVLPAAEADEEAKGWLAKSRRKTNAQVT